MEHEESENIVMDSEQNDNDSNVNEVDENDIDDITMIETEGDGNEEIREDREVIEREIGEDKEQEEEKEEKKEEEEEERKKKKNED